MQEPGLAPHRACQRREARRRNAQSLASFFSSSPASPHLPPSKPPGQTALRCRPEPRHVTQARPQSEDTHTSTTLLSQQPLRACLSQRRGTPQAPGCPRETGRKRPDQGSLLQHTQTRLPGLGWGLAFPCAPHDRLLPTAFLSEPLLSPQDPVMCPHSADL